MDVMPIYGGVDLQPGLNLGVLISFLVSTSPWPLTILALFSR